MAHHISVITEIATNQNKIKSSKHLIKYAKFAQLIKYAKLTNITENTDVIIAELLRLENILAFTRIFTTHHSVINIPTRNIMIDKLNLIHSKEIVLDL